MGVPGAARLAREASGETQESELGLQEAKRTTFKKVVFAWDCLHFFALGTPQDGPKRPRRGQKCVLREL